jgi:hypothetical protein
MTPVVRQSGDTLFPTAVAPLDVGALVPGIFPILGTLGAELELAAVERLCKQLPPVFRWAMLELRLRVGNDVDFMACVADTGSDRRNVAIHAAHPDLRVARRLLDAWGAARAWSSRVPIVWVEWDLSPTGPKSTLVSACVDPSFFDRNAESPSRAEQLAVMDAVLDVTLGDAALRARSLRGIARCVSALPGGVSITHLAPLAPRGGDACRVTVGLRPTDLLCWLEAIGWPGDRSAVEEWVSVIVPLWRRVFVQVEVADVVRPYLGVESRLIQSAADVAGSARPFLDKLAGSDLVCAKRLDAVLEWPGNACVLRGEATLARTLYFKLAPFNGEPLEAKAYLGVNAAPSA